MSCLAFVVDHEGCRLADKHNTVTNNMRAMFGEKTFDQDSIKRYTKKQFFLLVVLPDQKPGNPTELLDNMVHRPPHSRRWDGLIG